jgi:hypothetical protein
MKFCPLSLALVVAGQLLAGTADAQDRPERPYRGLFGSGGGDAEQELTVNASVGAGYDTSVLSDAFDAGLGGVSGPTQSRSGSYGLLSSGLSYSLNKSAIGIGASASTTARYYPSLADSLVTTWGAGIGASWRPTTRTSVNANHHVTHQPFSLFSLFPQIQQQALGQVFVPDLDYNTLQRGYFTHQTGVGVSRQLSRRAAISADYSRQRSDFDSLYDFETETASVRFTRSLTSGLGLRLGYGYTDASYGDDQESIGRHHLDTGVDYSKTLSFSRRTTFSFSTGGSAVKGADRMHFTAIGSANLNHEIGRTWDFSTAYNRNIGFIETFSTPFIYDAVNVGLSGLLSRRLSFHSGAGLIVGNVGLGSSASGNGFDTLYASTGVGRALGRHLQLGLDYSFYRYSFEQNALLPAGFLNDMSRHSVRATLSAWSPVFQRGRRRQ